MVFTLCQRYTGTKKLPHMHQELSLGQERGDDGLLGEEPALQLVLLEHKARVAVGLIVCLQRQFEDSNKMQ